MNWFVIIYTASKVAGIVGPMPEEAVCQKRAGELQISITRLVELGVSKKGTPVPAHVRQNMKRMEFKCEQRTVKPTYGESNV